MCGSRGVDLDDTDLLEFPTQLPDPVRRGPLRPAVECRNRVPDKEALQALQAEAALRG